MNHSQFVSLLRNQIGLMLLALLSALSPPCVAETPNGRDQEPLAASSATGAATTPNPRLAAPAPASAVDAASAPLQVTVVIPPEREKSQVEQVLPLLATFIGGLLTALIAFFGVNLQIRNSARLARAQWRIENRKARTQRAVDAEKSELDRDHASAEAQKQRVRTVRREVYLEAVGHVQKVQFEIAGLHAADDPHKQMKECLLPLVEATARIGMVSNQGLLLAARAINMRLLEFALRALAAVRPIQQLVAEAKQKLEYFQETEAAIGKLARKQAPLQAEGTQDAESSDVKTQLTAMLELKRALHNRLGELDDEIASAREDYRLFVQHTNDSLAPALDDLFVRLRKHIGLSTNLEIVSKQTTELIQRVKDVNEELRAKAAK